MAIYPTVVEIFQSLPSMEPCSWLGLNTYWWGILCIVYWNYWIYAVTKVYEAAVQLFYSLREPAGLVCYTEQIVKRTCQIYFIFHWILYTFLILTLVYCASDVPCSLQWYLTGCGRLWWCHQSENNRSLLSWKQHMEVREKTTFPVNVVCRKHKSHIVFMLSDRDYKLKHYISHQQSATMWKCIYMETVCSLNTQQTAGITKP